MFKEFDKNRTVQYKKRKGILSKIIFTVVVEICEVRYEYPDDSYTVVNEDSVNNNLDKTQKDISEHDILIDGHDDDEKEITAERKEKGEIHRVITENETKFYQDALDKVINEFPYEKNPDDMQECVSNEDDDKKEITADNEGEGVIHRDITDCENVNIWDTVGKVIQEFPDDTSSIDMKEGVENEDDEKKEITSENEDEGVININIIEKEK